MREGRIVAASVRAPRPASAVSTGAGLGGLVLLLVWSAVAFVNRIDGPLASLVALLACGLPMLAWSWVVDKVHRRASTGIDWSNPPRPLATTWRISAVKLAGLWATFAGIGFLYCVGRWYWEGSWLFAMHCLGVLIVPVAIGAIPYLLWIDRRLVSPLDELHAFGRFVLAIGTPDKPAIDDHLRAWAVKGFFLAFMLSVLPGNWANMIDVDHAPLADPLAHPALVAGWLIAAMFMIDVSFATVGYLCTLRPLDAHIRTANPLASAWAAALICYPPSVLMGAGGPLDYHEGAGDWTMWLAGHPILLALWGAALVTLTAIYAWATIAFGPRFSNLTNRGIITGGPYAWSRHPAYLSKNLFWWLSTLPFFATTGLLTDCVRNSCILAAVSGVYFWRAKTEEAHLRADRAYQAYDAWMAEHGAVPRLFRWVSHTPASTAATPDL